MGGLGVVSGCACPEENYFPISEINLESEQFRGGGAFYWQGNSIERESSIGILRPIRWLLN